MSNPNGDTPNQNEPQNAPATGQDTPPNGESQPSGDDKNELERERARAATALKDKDAAEKRARDEKIARIKAEKALAAATGGGQGGGSDTTPSGSEDTEAVVVRANAEKGVFALIAGTATYQELLSKDPTLKDVLLNNPLSLIREYIDAEDAVDQVKKYLDGRLQAAPGTSTAPAQDAGGSQPPKDVQAPGGGQGGGGAAPKYTAESIRSMSPDEWAKIPQEQRAKMLQGDFS